VPFTAAAVAMSVPIGKRHAVSDPVLRGWICILSRGSGTPRSPVSARRRLCFVIRLRRRCSASALVARSRTLRRKDQAVPTWCFNQSVPCPPLFFFFVAICGVLSWRPRVPGGLAPTYARLRPILPPPPRYGLPVRYTPGPRVAVRARGMFRAAGHRHRATHHDRADLTVILNTVGWRTC